MDTVAAWTAALTDPNLCPDCRAGLPAEPTACPACGLPLRGPLVDRLWQLSVQAARTLEQRRTVLATLRTRSATVPGDDAVTWGGSSMTDPWQARVPAPATVDGGRRPFFDPEPDEPAAAPERVTPRRIQHLLLGLGALLLGIAALIFTVVAWGQIGIGGRTAILGAVTATAAAGTALAHRRSLTGTAEALAALTLALLLLDAYGLRSADVGGLGGTAADSYWAVALAVLAAVAFAAGQAVPLRTLAVAAAFGAQLPLAVLADRFSPAALTVAALVQGAVAVLAARLPGLPEVRTTLGTGGGLALGGGAVAAAVLGYGADGAPVVAAGTGSGLLLATAAAAALTAWQLRAVTPIPQLCSAVAVAALLAAAHAPLHRAWSHEAATTAGAGFLAGAAVLLAMALPRLPERWQVGPLSALGVGAALAVLGVLEPLGAAATGPLHWWDAPWSADVRGTSRELLGVRWPHPGGVALTTALLAAGAAVLAARRGGPAPVRAAAGVVAAGTATATVLMLPVAVDLPYLAGVLGLVVAGGLASIGAAWVAPRTTGRPDQASRCWGAATATLAGAGALTAALGLAWSLAARPATWQGLLGLLLGAAAVRQVALRRTGAIGADAERAAEPGTGPMPAVPARLATAVGVAAAAAEAGVLARVAGAEVAAAVAVAIGVAGALAVGAGRLADGEERIAAEASAALAAAVAFAFVAGDPGGASLALLVAGTAAALVALRPGRRRVGWLAGALLTLSSWIRLAMAEVEHPEAYTTGPAVALLVAGWCARRGARGADQGSPGSPVPAAPSSWAAYGPGLVTGLVPGLLYSLGAPGPARPLLLGLVALGALLAGVRARLAAPLVIGATVLGVDALVQVGPYAAALPRWVGIGGAGVLLLVLGITFERRLRELRVWRDRLAALG